MDGDGWAQHMIDATRDEYNSLGSEEEEIASRRMDGKSLCSEVETTIGVS